MLSNNIIVIVVLLLIFISIYFSRKYEHVNWKQLILPKKINKSTDINVIFVKGDTIKNLYNKFVRHINIGNCLNVANLIISNNLSAHIVVYNLVQKSEYFYNKTFMEKLIAEWISRLKTILTYSTNKTAIFNIFKSKLIDVLSIFTFIDDELLVTYTFSNTNGTLTSQNSNNIFVIRNTDIVINCLSEKDLQTFYGRIITIINDQNNKSFALSQIIDKLNNLHPIFVKMFLTNWEQTYKITSQKLVSFQNTLKSFIFVYDKSYVQITFASNDNSIRTSSTTTYSDNLFKHTKIFDMFTNNKQYATQLENIGSTNIIYGSIDDMQEFCEKINKSINIQTPEYKYNDYFLNTFIAKQGKGTLNDALSVFMLIDYKKSIQYTNLQFHNNILSYSHNSIKYYVCYSNVIMVYVKDSDEIQNFRKQMYLLLETQGIVESKKYINNINDEFYDMFADKFSKMNKNNQLDNTLNLLQFANNDHTQIYYTTVIDDIFSVNTIINNTSNNNEYQIFTLFNK